MITNIDTCIKYFCIFINDNKCKLIVYTIKVLAKIVQNKAF